jgi:mercuric reductase
MSEKKVRVIVPIQGMTCSSCEEHTKQALKNAGAENITVDYHGGEAQFTINDKELDKTKVAIKEVGYQPGDVKILADDTVRVKIPVQGMTCISCEGHVTKALQEIGAVNIETSFQREETLFEITEQRIDKAKDAIQKTGYVLGKEQILSGKENQ